MMNYAGEGIAQFILIHDLIHNPLWSVTNLVVISNEMKGPL